MLTQSEKSSSGELDDSWSHDGWRGLAARRLTWLSIAILVLPLTVTAMQRVPGSLAYIAISLLLPIAAFLTNQRPRLGAVLMIATWVGLTCAVAIAIGIVAPAATLMMAVYSIMLAVFFGRVGLLVSIVITVVVVASILLAHFGFGITLGSPSTAEILNPNNPSNLLRIGMIAVLFVGLLTFAISYIVRQIEVSLSRLRVETQDKIVAERAFQEAQKHELVAQITSGLAHNFGNTLMIISTWAELIKRHPDDPEFLQRGLKDVAAASAQAAAIARQIMVVSKSYVRNPEIVNLCEEIKRQIKLAETLLPSSVAIKQDLMPTASVELDRNEFQQGLLNLLLNARDAVDGHGVIHLRLWSENDRVLLSIKDNGIGMSKEILANVFQPFFTTKGLRGTGLGLASLKQSVEAANGSIHVESTVGVGTTFTLSFRALEVEEQAECPAASQQPTSSSSARILVVDDEDMLRDVLVTALRSFGHDVIDAIDVPDGIAKCRENSELSLLFTDAVMPGGRLTDLIEVFEECHPKRPIIVCSGYMRDDVGVQNVQERGIEFVQKPVDFDDLREQISRLLAEKDEVVRG